MSISIISLDNETLDVSQNTFESGKSIVIGNFTADHQKFYELAIEHLKQEFPLDDARTWFKHQLQYARIVDGYLQGESAIQLYWQKKPYKDHSPSFNIGSYRIGGSQFCDLLSYLFWRASIFGSDDPRLTLVQSFTPKWEPDYTSTKAQLVVSAAEIDIRARNYALLPLMVIFGTYLTFMYAFSLNFLLGFSVVTVCCATSAATMYYLGRQMAKRDRVLSDAKKIETHWDRMNNNSSHSKSYSSEVLKSA